MPFTSRDWLAGVTAILVNTAEVTLSDAELLKDFTLAVIVDCPVLSPVARPVALTETTDGLEELHVARVVRFCLLPSLNVPVAVNCSVVPAAILGLARYTAKAVNVADVIVSEAELLIDPMVAVMVA